VLLKKVSVNTVHWNRKDGRAKLRMFEVKVGNGKGTMEENGSGEARIKRDSGQVHT
jgi:hypothetical protein